LFYQFFDGFFCRIKNFFGGFRNFFGSDLKASNIAKGSIKHIPNLRSLFFIPCLFNRCFFPAMEDSPFGPHGAD
jgi:hypothetical protein